MTNFKIHKERSVQRSAEEELQDQDTIFYTIFGKHDWLDDEGFPRVNKEAPDAYAKSISGNTKTKFFVKRGRYGKLYNPIGLYSEGTANKQLRHAGKPEWEFREETEKVFDFYIRFLKTKNSAWLNNAEREQHNMGKLSKAKKMTEVEKYCIQGMHYNEMSAEDISKTLGRDLEDVQSYVGSLDQEDGPTFIINETTSGTKGVSIMTQAGSERVDALRERPLPARNTANTIHSIHD